MKAKSQTLSPRPSSTILFEGDSLTRFAGGPSLDNWAWMRMTGASYGYPEKVGDWIFCNRPDLNISCRTGAVAGSRLCDVLERFEHVTQAFKPEIVVMTIGTNDKNRGVPLAEFRADAETYCKRLQDLCGGKVLYLGNMPVTNFNDSEETKANRETKRPYATTMAEVVEAHDGLAIDLGTMLGNRMASLVKLWPGHTIYHDNTHFNMVGNEIVAGIVLRALGLMTVPGDPDGGLLGTPFKE